MPAGCIRGYSQGPGPICLIKGDYSSEVSAGSFDVVASLDEERSCHGYPGRYRVAMQPLLAGVEPFQWAHAFAVQSWWGSEKYYEPAFKLFHEWILSSSLLLGYDEINSLPLTPEEADSVEQVSYSFFYFSIDNFYRAVYGGKFDSPNTQEGIGPLTTHAPMPYESEEALAWRWRESTCPEHGDSPNACEPDEKIFIVRGAWYLPWGSGIGKGLVCPVNPSEPGQPHDTRNLTCDEADLEEGRSDFVYPNAFITGLNVDKKSAPDYYNILLHHKDYEPSVVVPCFRSSSQWGSGGRRALADGFWFYNPRQKFISSPLVPSVLQVAEAYTIEKAPLAVVAEVLDFPGLDSDVFYLIKEEGVVIAHPPAGANIMTTWAETLVYKTDQPAEQSGYHRIYSGNNEFGIPTDVVDALGSINVYAGTGRVPAALYLMPYADRVTYGFDFADLEDDRHQVPGWVNLGTWQNPNFVPALRSNGPFKGHPNTDCAGFENIADPVNWFFWVIEFDGSFVAAAASGTYTAGSDTLLAVDVYKFDMYKISGRDTTYKDEDWEPPEPGENTPPGTYNYDIAANGGVLDRRSNPCLVNNSIIPGVVPGISFSVEGIPYTHIREVYNVEYTFEPADPENTGNWVEDANSEGVYPYSPSAPGEGTHVRVPVYIAPGVPKLVKTASVKQLWKDELGGDFGEMEKEREAMGMAITVAIFSDMPVLITFGGGDYTGSNSPAHVEGVVPTTRREWVGVTGPDAEVTTTIGEEDYDITIETRSGGTGADGAVTFGSGGSGAGVESRTIPAGDGSGVFDSAATRNWQSVVGDPSDKAQNIGVSFTGYPEGTYFVYAVVHNQLVIDAGVEVGVGIGVGPSSVTSLAWNDESLTSTSFPPSPRTDKWELGENYARVLVTVTEENNTIYVVQGGFETEPGQFDLKAITLAQIVPAPVYTVVYLKNHVDATGTMEPSIHIYQSASNLTLNAFVRVGYLFDSWNTEEDGTGTAYADGQVVTDLASSGSVGLFAQWVPITYTVKYDINDGSGSMDPTTHTFDEPKALRENAFTRDGHHYTGWNTEPDGSGTSFADQESVMNLATDHGAEVTLYAQWMSNIVYVRQDGNDSASGGSWEEAFATVQKALSHLQFADMEIYIAAGTYFAYINSFNDSFVIPRNVSIYGGFNPTTPEASPAEREVTMVHGIRTMAHQTILSGTSATDPSQHVVNVIEAGGTAQFDAFTLDGITVRDGRVSNYRQAGAAIASWPAVNGTLRNCVIRDNETHQADITDIGAAVVFRHPSWPATRELHVEHTLFYNNKTSTGWSAALETRERCEATVQNCRVEANEGGGFVFRESSQVKDTVFVGNTGNEDNAGDCIVYPKEGDHVVDACLFKENVGPWGLLFLHWDWGADKTVLIKNCRCENNIGGLLDILRGSVTVVNTVMTGNTGYPQMYVANTTADLTVLNCVFHNNDSEDSWAGAVYAGWHASTFVANSIFVGNHTNNEGGAIYALECAVNVAHSTFYGNTAGTGADGIHTNDTVSRINVYNSIFWGDYSAIGDILRIGTNPEIHNVLVPGGSAGISRSGGNVSQILWNASWENTDIFEDDFDFSDSAYDWFSAEEENIKLKLTEGSPAVDAGNASYTSEDKDITGETDRVVGDHPDLGAYERPEDE